MCESQPKSLEETTSDNIMDTEPNPDIYDRDDYVGSHTGDEVEDLMNS